jgi:hypothetical protein
MSRKTGMVCHQKLKTGPDVTLAIRGMAFSQQEIRTQPFIRTSLRRLAADVIPRNVGRSVTFLGFRPKGSNHIRRGILARPMRGAIASAAIKAGQLMARRSQSMGKTVISAMREVIIGTLSWDISTPGPISRDSRSSLWQQRFIRYSWCSFCAVYSGFVSLNYPGN